MSADHIHFFLQLRNQIKLYHWQTHVYARHIATDKQLEEIEERIDSFVEVYIGKYGRPKISGKNSVITLQNLTEAGACRVVRAAIKHLQTVITRDLDPELDSELITIKDDMIKDMGQLLYLFTLH
jgi:hypothetical protein